MPDQGPKATSVKERLTTKHREGVRSAVNRDLRGERGIVKRIHVAAGVSEKQVENSEGRPGQARTRAIGRSGAWKSHEFRRAKWE